MEGNCLSFRHINCTLEYEEQQRLISLIEQSSKYLGRSPSGTSYFQHTRRDGIKDLYSKQSHTQMQWLGENFPVPDNLIHKL
jgi:hypothetical protein